MGLDPRPRDTRHTYVKRLEIGRVVLGRQERKAYGGQDCRFQTEGNPLISGIAQAPWTGVDGFRCSPGITLPQDTDKGSSIPSS